MTKQLLCWIVFTCLTVCISSCRSPLQQIQFQADEPFLFQEISEHLRLQFHGTASFYLEYRGAAVLTDPFLSNPSSAKVTFGKIRPDSLLLNKLNPQKEGIQMITISHGHYDHLLDLPWFLQYLSPDVKVLGSQNTVSLLQTLPKPPKLIETKPVQATISQPGTWIYSQDSSIRILAIESEHLPHILCFRLYHGPFSKPPEQFPQRARHFKEDLTNAYLIDFLDSEKRPAKRIFFGSSAVASPYGRFPDSVLAEKKVDLAILSVALFQKAKTNPEKLISWLKPARIIVCHWENFFLTREQGLKPVSLTNFRKIFAWESKLSPQIPVEWIKPGHSRIVRD